jgi:hypothetical protein
VFLMCRMSPVMEYAPVALAIVTVVGATTALFAATIGCVQNDIKRIIAYCTCSQLGYMFFAAGVGLYQAAMFTSSPMPSSRRCCSWARQRDPRHVGRAGHPPHGRHLAQDPRDLRRDVDRLAGARRRALLRRLLLEGRHPGGAIAAHSGVGSTPSPAASSPPS